VEAYSELLQVLAGLRDEPRSPWAARVIGPVVGAATLGALLLPSQVGLIAGALLGLAIGLRWRHLDLRPS
jgi:hypothetical protein